MKNHQEILSPLKNFEQQSLFGMPLADARKVYDGAMQIVDLTAVLRPYLDLNISKALTSLMLHAHQAFNIVSGTATRSDTHGNALSAKLIVSLNRSHRIAASAYQKLRPVLCPHLSEKLDLAFESVDSGLEQAELWFKTLSTTHFESGVSATKQLGSSMTTNSWSIAYASSPAYFTTHLPALEKISTLDFFIGKDRATNTVNFSEKLSSAGSVKNVADIFKILGSRAVLRDVIDLQIDDTRPDVLIVTLGS